MPVLENSIAEFIQSWKHHATLALVYPQPEGSPLLEVRIGGRVIYVLDRVGPYAARPGEANLIVHPVAETVSRVQATEEILKPVGVSRIEAVGPVLETARGFVVVQARAPLVVGVFDDSWRDLKPGEFVSVQSLEPVHGFYLGTKKRS
jgi:hypothetical protein